ncbi:MAG: serine/threonine-protein kinase [Gemmataceae bacterium]
MPAPATTDEFLELVRKSGLVEDTALTAFLKTAGPLPQVPAEAAAQLYLAGLITPWQGGQLLRGVYKPFRLAGYRLLDKFGEVEIGSVFQSVNLARIPISLIVWPDVLANKLDLLEGVYRSAGPGVLYHQNAVRLLDIYSEESVLFLVMEMIEGTQLSRVLLNAGGHLPVGEACGCAIQVAAGLQAAHEAGLVHRHIRPSNVFVNETGLVKIFGLGLHRAFDAALKESQDESLWDYSAPEQALDGPVDCWTDIYSLGATLYHLIAGHAPRRFAPTHTHFTIPPILAVRSDVPETLSPIVAKMIEKRPENRYQSMAEVIAALRPFVEPAPVGNFPPMAEAALG